VYSGKRTNITIVTPDLEGLSQGEDVGVGLGEQGIRKEGVYSSLKKSPSNMGVRMGGAGIKISEELFGAVSNKKGKAFAGGRRNRKNKFAEESLPTFG